MQKSKSIITLITDFGLKDEYVGLLKAVIKSINPKVQIIDITHQIKPQDLIWPAYLIQKSFKYFPENTIHLIIVDPGVGTKRRILLAKINKQIFICPDNGIITKISENYNIESIHLAENKKYFLENISSTFHGRDVFAPVAGYLSLGERIDNFGQKIAINSINLVELPSIKLDNKSIRGQIIHVDRFGNLVTNIEKDIINNLDSDFRYIKVKIKNTLIKSIKKSYQDVNISQYLAVIGSRELLEISVNRGNAAKKLKVNCQEKIKVFI